MTSTLSKSSQLYQERLSRSTLAFFLPRSMATILVAGALAYFCFYVYWQNEITSQMTSIVDAQATQTEMRMKLRDDLLTQLLIRPAFATNLESEFPFNRDKASFKSLRSRMIQEFQSANRTGSEAIFADFLVASLDSTILVASNPNWEGRRLMGSTLEGMLGEHSSMAVYNPTPLYQNRLLIFSARPILNSNNALIASIIGVSEPLAMQINLEAGNSIDYVSNAYYYTKDGYIIRLGPDKLGLTALQPTLEQKARLQNFLTGNLKGITKDILNLENKPVRIYTKILPSLQSSLAIEMPREALLAPITGTLPFALLILVSVLVVIGLIIWLGTNRLVKPVTTLCDSARRFVEGEWHQRFSVNRNDEIGLLANSFNKMADELTNLYVSVESKGEGRTKQGVPVQIEPAVEKIPLSASSQTDLEEAHILYSVSRQITQADSFEEIYQVIARALDQETYLAAALVAEEEDFRIVSIKNEASTNLTSSSQRLNLHPVEIESLLQPDHPFLIIDPSQNSNLPDPLLQLLNEWKCKTAALLPIRRGDKLAAVILLGSYEKEHFTPVLLQPYANLAELATTALDKVEALQRMGKRLNELQTLGNVSQVVSLQVNLDEVYSALQEAVNQIMGEVNFSIALYDSQTNLISIPYMFEGTERLIVEPFPLGKGLTSIIIRNRQPLMLVEDTERQLKELGAKIVGAIPKSWLGVPLMVEGDVIGAMIVQDLEQEGRFSEDDQRLLSTLASQVAVTVRNARLLEQSRQQARRERLLFEATKKIRSSVDMDTILLTTAREVSKAIGARSAHIEIGLGNPVSQATKPEETEVS